MKRLIYISLAIAFGLCTAYSCVKGVDDKFDKSASKRMEEALANYRTILTSAPNGWIMKYFPESKQKFGGYTFLMKFPADEEEVVYVSSEIANDLSVQVKSKVSIKDDMGPTLNFDSYNDLFNYFSDPSISGGDGKGYGYLGDYEFVFEKVTPQEIVLMGKKTNNKIVMIPLAADILWTDYLEKIVTIEDISMSGKYMLKVEGYESDIDVFLSNKGRYMNLEGFDENGSFIITTTGIQFYEPLEVNKILMRNFDWNNDNLEFVCTDPGVNAILKAETMTAYEMFVNGKWYFKSGNFGSDTEPAWNTFKTLVANAGELVAFAYFGDVPPAVSSVKKPSFTFGCYDYSQTWWGYLVSEYTPDNIKTNQITIALTGERLINGNYYYSTLSQLMTAITGPITTDKATQGKTYKIVADNPLRPKTLTLTDTSNPNNWFTLFATEVILP